MLCYGHKNTGSNLVHVTSLYILLLYAWIKKKIKNKVLSCGIILIISKKHIVSFLEVYYRVFNLT